MEKGGYIIAAQVPVQALAQQATDQSAYKEVSNRNEASTGASNSYFRKAGLSYVYFLFHLANISWGRRTMNAVYSPHLQDRKKESLQTQYDFLKLLRLRHLQWTNVATDSQVEGVHLEIAELLEEITDRYNDLLDRVQQSDPEGYP